MFLSNSYVWVYSLYVCNISVELGFFIIDNVNWYRFILYSSVSDNFVFNSLFWSNTLAESKVDWIFDNSINSLVNVSFVVSEFIPLSSKQSFSFLSEDYIFLPMLFN